MKTCDFKTNNVQQHCAERPSKIPSDPRTEYKYLYYRFHANVQYYVKQKTYLYNEKMCVSPQRHERRTITAVVAQNAVTYVRKNRFSNCSWCIRLSRRRRHNIIYYYYVVYADRGFFFCSSYKIVVIIIRIIMTAVLFSPISIPAAVSYEEIENRLIFSVRRRSIYSLLICDENDIINLVCPEWFFDTNRYHIPSVAQRLLSSC